MQREALPHTLVKGTGAMEEEPNKDEEPKEP